MRDEDHPLNRGFDYYFGFTASGSNFYNPSSLFRNFEPVEESEYLTDAFTREALAFISNRPVEKPFFVFLSYNAPHIPVYEPAPAKYLNRFDTGNAAVDNYYAKLNAVDEGIHQIRALLEARGEWDNTFVVYFSDNGAVADSPHPRNAPLRGFKGKLEQGGIRVPMVWRLPGSLAQAAGTLVEEPVSSMDILPTALALAGLEEASGQKIDGVNLLPFLVENKPWPAQRRLFYAGSHASHWSIDNLPFWQSYQQYLAEGDRSAPHPESEMIEKHGPGGLSVRHGRWWMRWDGDSGEFQLFDMSNDIGESHDLAAVHPEKVIDLKKQISAWLAPLPPPNHWNKSYWKAMRKAVGLSPE